MSYVLKWSQDTSSEKDNFSSPSSDVSLFSYDLWKQCARELFLIFTFALFTFLREESQFCHTSLDAGRTNSNANEACEMSCAVKMEMKDEQ